MYVCIQTQFTQTSKIEYIRFPEMHQMDTKKSAIFSRIPRCLDNRLRDGVKVVSLMRRPRSTPQKHYFCVSDTHFCYRLSKLQDLVRPEGLGKLKKKIIIHLIGSRTRDLPFSFLPFLYTIYSMVHSPLADTDRGVKQQTRKGSDKETRITAVPDGTQVQAGYGRSHRKQTGPRGKSTASASRRETWRTLSALKAFPSYLTVIFQSRPSRLLVL
jgi:hypothetical protein